jgi:hypothetical protein
MNWDAEPATQNQLAYLKLFGYVPENPLTKSAAHDLLDQFEEDPARREIRRQNQLREANEYEKDLAFNLHRDCDEAARKSQDAPDKYNREAAAKLRDCQKYRVLFWKDTFGGNEHLAECDQGWLFFRKWGCQFKTPSAEKIQAVLGALDSKLPTWDKDNPKLFYETLELNFPELLRKEHR